MSTNAAKWSGAVPSTAGPFLKANLTGAIRHRASSNPCPTQKQCDSDSKTKTKNRQRKNPERIGAQEEKRDLTMATFFPAAKWVTLRSRDCLREPYTEGPLGVYNPWTPKNATFGARPESSAGAAEGRASGSPRSKVTQRRGRSGVARGSLTCGAGGALQGRRNGWPTRSADRGQGRSRFVGCARRIGRRSERRVVRFVSARRRANGRRTHGSAHTTHTPLVRAARRKKSETGWRNALLVNASRI
jgi:hypothetical protein